MGRRSSFWLSSGSSFGVECTKLNSPLAAVVGAERFLTEIKTTANLQHPRILPLFDSGLPVPTLSRF
jgi:hypothetical protein